MPSKVSLELKKEHQIASYRRCADELRVSARDALDTRHWPTLWALAEGYDDLADFLESPCKSGPPSAGKPHVLSRVSRL
jgi:hypothetical protein